MEPLLFLLIIIKAEPGQEQLNIFNMQSAVSVEPAEYVVSESENQRNRNTQDVYEVIKNFIRENMEDGLDIDQASSRFHVTREQMKDWLKRLCDDKILICKKGIYYKN